MRTLKLSLVGMLAACTAGASAADSPATHDFGWLSGHWCLESDGEAVEEYWLAPRGGSLLGLSRTVRAGKMTTFEFLRIELREGTHYYLAQPEGRPSTAFRLTASGANWARFENADHDFPKRVEYRRTASGLHAEIAGPGRDGEEKVIPFEYRACAP